MAKYSFAVLFLWMFLSACSEDSGGSGSSGGSLTACGSDSPGKVLPKIRNSMAVTLTPKAKSFSGFNQPLIFDTSCSTVACNDRIIVYDLNCDGQKDIIVHKDMLSNGSSYNYPSNADANKSGGRGNVYLNTGSEFQLSAEIPTAGGEFISDFGDLNRDGIPDMVTYTFWRNGISVYRGITGSSGLFAQSEVYYATGTHGGEAYIVDYNNDGIGDIISASNGSGSPLIAHFFKGSGRLALSKELSVTAAWGTPPDYADASSTAYFHSLFIVDIGENQRLDLFADEARFSTALINTGSDPLPKTSWKGYGLTMRTYAVSHAFFVRANHNILYRRAFVNESDKMIYAVDLDFNASGQTVGNDESHDTDISYDGYPSPSYSRADGGLVNTDINGDGLPDLLIPLPKSDGTELGYIAGIAGGGFEKTFRVIDATSLKGSAFERIPINDSQRIAVDDFNGDSLPDIAIIVNLNWQWYASASEAGDDTNRLLVYLSK